MESITKTIEHNKSKIDKAQILNIAIKYFFCFVAFYFLSIARINTTIPFWFGLFVALIVTKENPFAISLLFVLGFFLSDLNIANLVIATNMAGVMMIAFLIHNHLHKKINFAFTGLYVILGNIAFIYYNISPAQTLISAGISLLIGLIFTYCCIITLSAIKSRNYAFRLNIDEAVCCGVLVLALFCGVYQVNFFGFDVAKFIAVILILILSYFSQITGTIFAVAVGLGIAFASNNVGYIPLFVLMSIFASIFKTSSRIYSVLAVIAIEVLFGVYFNIFSSYDMLAPICTIAGCIVYICIPTKWLKSLNNHFIFNDSSAVKNIYNQNRSLMSKKLFGVSEVFFEMDKVYRQFVKGVLSVEDAKKMLAAELIDSCCNGCKDKNKCLHTIGEEIRTILNDLFNIAFEKGKISILDLPPYLTSRCNKASSMVGIINSLVYQYKQYSNMMTNLDNSKILIAEQLSGVSKIMRELSKELDTPIAFDTSKENKIIEELTYKNIVCKEVAVYEQNKNICRVSLVLRNADIDNPEIPQIINSVTKSVMKLDNITPSVQSGLSTIDYKVASKYDMVLGLASSNKDNNNISGDCHSLQRIGDNKFMLAICDGMGSGEGAEKISNLTISLVENFYKANFDSETILSSVNKLVSLNNGERFSSLDIAVVDLNDGVGDFIKLGACEGYIKTKESVIEIPSGALPVGMLDEIAPKITKTVLDSGDCVILVSDGISDVFKEKELINYINNLTTTNPQAIAEAILEKALSIDNGLPHDDMTVLVGKLFINS